MTPDSGKDRKTTSASIGDANNTVDAPRVSPSAQPGSLGQVLLAFAAALFVLFVMIRIIMAIGGVR